MLAATVRVTRDLDLAEECVQDAYAQALTTWATTGAPTNAGAWLTTVARRRALDLLRRDTLWRRAIPLLVEEESAPSAEEHLGVLDAERTVEIPDDRLRLICTCCHPALSREAQVALTLRLVCGLSTAEVARAFLVSDATMAARITRAKKKISLARIPYRVPALAELPQRLTAVAEVVHLVFTMGHTAAAGTELMRTDLIDRSLDLARMLHTLRPENSEIDGLLALLLLTDSRRHARVDAEGELVLLANQDRSAWDSEAIAEGTELVRSALRRDGSGRYALQAAIAAVHAEASSFDETNWQEIVGLYDLLQRQWPSPVVALNRAVAVGFASGAQAGLDAVEELATEPRLASYPYLASARADFLRQLGRTDEAKTAYTEAILLTDNDVERAFLSKRLEQC